MCLSILTDLIKEGLVEQLVIMNIFDKKFPRLKGMIWEQAFLKPVDTLL